MSKNKSYYEIKLASQKLRKVYDSAPSRIKQYLEAEIEYVLQNLKDSDRVLELGCGYGRVLGRLAEKSGFLLGIDLSLTSLKDAQKDLTSYESCFIACMNAGSLGLKEKIFDAVVCIQNGISAFHLNPKKLLKQALRATAPGGKLFFSSYSPRFWKERLEWFHFQSELGLIGEIDEKKTGDGIIVCKDGFKAVTFTEDDFSKLAAFFDLTPQFQEIDGSSLFCEIKVPDSFWI